MGARNEVSARLSLLGRQKFSAEAEKAEQDITGLGRASARASRSVADSAASTEASHSRMKAGIVAAGAAASVAIGAFATKSVDKYQEVAKETLKLQRYTGQSAAEASRLRFAAQESGVGMDKLASGMGRFSKTIMTTVQAQGKQDARMREVNAGYAAQIKALGSVAKPTQRQSDRIATLSGKLEENRALLAVHAGGVKLAGIAFTDAAGKVRPMNDVLLDASERLKGMKSGAEKSALVMKLFGKSGMDLLPFLNRGAAGIKDLEHESDKLGNTLNDKDTAAVKKNTAAKREMDATIDGLKVQLGRKLLPAMTRTVEKMGQMTQFTERHATASKAAGAAVGLLAAVVGALVVASKLHALVLATQTEGTFAFAVASKAQAAGTAIATAGQWLLNAALAANPIGLAVVAIALLAGALVLAWKKSEKFRSIVKAVFRAVGGFAINMADKVLGAVQWVFEGLGKMPGKLGAPFRTAATKIQDARDKLHKLKADLDNFGKPKITVQVGVNATNFRQWLNNPASFIPDGVRAPGIPGVTAPATPKKAAGGRVQARRPYIVGERRPELFVPDQNGRIEPTVPLSMPAMPVWSGGDPAGGDGAEATSIVVHSVLHLDGRVVAESTDRVVAATRARRR